MTEKQLDNRGYEFTGKYASGPDGKERMKAEAAELRKQGWQAVVFHKVYPGRVTSSDGYSVYKREKVTTARLKAAIGTRVMLTIRPFDEFYKPVVLEGDLRHDDDKRWLVGKTEFDPRRVDILDRVKQPETNILPQPVPRCRMISPTDISHDP